MELVAKKIKVCFIAPKAYPLFDPNVTGVFGGTEVDLYTLATELAEDERFDVNFIAADYRQKAIETINLVRIFKSLDFKEFPVSSALKVWQVMRRVDAQIYFLQGVSLGTSLAASFCKLHKKIFVYRTASSLACDGTYLREHYFKGRFFRWSLRKASQVIVQNDNDKRDIMRTIGVDPLVIQNGQYLPAVSRTRREAVIWIGRSAEVKKPQLFLDLARQLPQESFVMICQQATGDNSYGELVGRARQVRNVEFIERVPFNEIDAHFQRAKVFVNTSDSEGFPNTYVQACKNGTPIVSLNVNPDDFLNKYKCGLCADGDWDIFLSNLRKMLNTKERKQYAENARLYAEETHDIRIIVEKYKELFSNLLRKRCW